MDLLNRTERILILKSQKEGFSEWLWDKGNASEEFWNAVRFLCSQSLREWHV